MTTSTNTFNVYIDGFNLYYGRLKGHAECKWLDPVELCRKLLPGGQKPQRVRYFTARIKPRPDDPDGPQRQDAYLRALASLPEITIHYGTFLQSTPRMRLAEPPPDGPNTVKVIKTEEKATDVQIASHMLMDAFRRDCGTVVLVSNDSDLREPLRMIKEDLDLSIGILNPCDRQSRSLAGLHPAFHKPIRHGAVRDSQLPDTVTLGGGAEVKRPQRWR
ncbi:NYN domain-containing protein [Streptomyces triticiradicis]|uniref:NYN domain-containing protein n=1 Tax=Streptomyces triticiradicis TaxID=2651189 RepID=A0A7J5DJ54_9ACTN|nr:NYN domain-containing protein [Streptomyces triticiradicis]KAB1988726.1 NYN domain-containing protein [Streptomyces triticiradicis]